MSSKRSARPPRPPRPHGAFLAGDVGELVGVSGTTIGQWARRGYVRASVSDAVPHVYSIEDVAEAAVVAELLRRGVRRPAVRRLVARLSDELGDWPLSEAVLATADGAVFRRVDGDVFALGARGWQEVVVAPDLEEVRLRLRRPG